MCFNQNVINTIIPEKKDLDRARNLNFRKNLKNMGPDSPPLQGKADSMAKLITNEAKLIRRAMAVAAYWGIEDKCVTIDGQEHCVNVWRPFAKKLEELGYGYRAITFISQYEHEDVIEQMGLEDLFF